MRRARSLCLQPGSAIAQELRPWYFRGIKLVQQVLPDQPTPRVIGRCQASLHGLARCLKLTDVKQRLAQVQGDYGRSASLQRIVQRIDGSTVASLGQQRPPQSGLGEGVSRPLHHGLAQYRFRSASSKPR